ncbi:glutamate receptor ionotropic, kainate 3-like [Babylonia areolata]|uniref:glutamate receptor ionotropic, kainate 3-like n=1 Tax=Babylonia areolata TaxID=304850 RepID=UPI003FD32652
MMKTKRRQAGGVMMTVMTVVMTVVMTSLRMQGVQGRCHQTEEGKVYKLAIGLLTTSRTNLTIQRTIQENIHRTGPLKDCFSFPHYLTLSVRDSLHIPSRGWTLIQSGINTALVDQGAEQGEVPNVIIGPFYTNLAMILEQLNIPYLVTDYKGFDWIDMSRVQDSTAWRTLVEIRPPAQEQNLAVVDLFASNSWQSAVMIMPESAADNQECQDLARQMLAAGISLIPYTVQPRQPNAREMVRQVLRNAQLFRQWHIIVCSPRDVRDRLIELVLDMARMFDLTLNEKQVFVLVDPSSTLKPMASAQDMYNLGLFSARCQLLAFRYVEPRKGQGAEDADKAAAIDAARVTTMALNNYLRQQKAAKIITNLFSPDRFLQQLKQVRLPHGHTGALQFNSTGQRVNYKLHLYNHGGADMYSKIAEWSPNGDSPGTRLNLTGVDEGLARTTQYGIFPQLVKIVVVLEEPFVMTRKIGDQSLTGNDRFEGFTIDLIRELASQLKFKYEIYQSPGNAYGASGSDGTWDGMVGEVLNGNATLAAGAISITSLREEVIDFSLGVLSTGVNILIKKPEETRTIFQFMQPFSLELWMAILGSAGLVSVVFFLMDYTSRTDRRFTLKETIWFAIGTIMKRGTDFAPVRVSQRILTAGFTFFVLITVSTYTANMAAFLTTKNFGKTIDSFEMLAADDSMSCGTVDNSATLSFLKRGTKPVFRKLWSKVRSSRGLVPNATYGRQRVKGGGYAFIFDYLINSYSEMTNCSTQMASTPILMQEHGLGMAAGAPFKTSINIALLRLKERGFLRGLKKKWWDDKRRCDDESNTRSEQQEFGLEHMAGVFIVGLLGLGAALALFLFKKLYFLAKRAHQRHRNQKQGAGSDSGSQRSSQQKLGTPALGGREKERLCHNNTSFV